MICLTGRSEIFLSGFNLAFLQNGSIVVINRDRTSRENMKHKEGARRYLNFTFVLEGH